MADRVKEALKALDRSHGCFGDGADGNPDCRRELDALVEAVRQAERDRIYDAQTKVMGGDWLGGTWREMDLYRALQEDKQDA